jgi:hypothetical protein
MREIKKYKILAVCSKGKRTLGRPKLRWEIEIIYKLKKYVNRVRTGFN